MINFENDYFQKIRFASDKIEQFFGSAKRDLEIARDSDIPEVIFEFAYNALIKIGIALITGAGYKIRSKAGHHVKILQKMRQILNDENIEILGDKMRQNRNLNLYQGGSSVSEKDSQEYLAFVKDVFKKARANHQ